ncbi:hypothetical protein JHK84_043496 [Glycine max]|nr:hypothetical protein JHK86_043311 [Glycine max]KAG5117383.1 hypothetical protein JHK84_043496 [Glycine max]
MSGLNEMPVDDSFALDLSLAWTHQMLDQIQKQVELNNSTDIGTVVNNMSLKWVSKKGRTYIGKPSSLALPHGSSNTKSVGQDPSHSRHSSSSSTSGPSADVSPPPPNAYIPWNCNTDYLPFHEIAKPHGQFTLLANYSNPSRRFGVRFESFHIELLYSYRLVS